MKNIIKALIICLSVMTAYLFVGSVSNAAPNDKALSGEEALRMINSVSVREADEGEVQIGEMLSEELARETAEAETLSVKNVGGLREVTKSNGVVLLYDGDLLVGARA